MKPGLDTLHEKGWFKSLTAVAGLLVALLTIGVAATALLHREDRSPAANVAAPAPVSASVPAAMTIAPAQAPAQRTLDDPSRRQLLGILREKTANVLIACVRGDPEAKNYAREIQSFLQSQGYTAVSLAFNGAPGSFQGIDAAKDGGNKYIVRVGRR